MSDLKAAIRKLVTLDVANAPVDDEWSNGYLQALEDVLKIAKDLEVVGGESFKQELLASIKVIYQPHIEGVFAVWKSRVERREDE